MSSSRALHSLFLQRSLLSSSSHLSLLSSIPSISSTTSLLIGQGSHKRSYNDRVVDHYENPRNVGSLDKNDPNVGTGLVGAPACGDVMKLMLKFDDDGKIIDAKFKTFGCGSAIASSSYATEYVKGMDKDQATAIKNQDIAEHLKLPPVKIHCSMLAEDAIKAAVADFEKKQKAMKKE